MLAPHPLPPIDLVQEKLSDIAGHLIYFLIMILISVAAIAACAYKTVRPDNSTTGLHFQVPRLMEERGGGERGRGGKSKRGSFLKQREKGRNRAKKKRGRKRKRQGEKETMPGGDLLLCMSAKCMRYALMLSGVGEVGLWGKPAPHR